MPQLTCDLLQYPITFSMTWKHLSDISLDGPHFNHPGKIDVLLGVDVFAQVSRGGRQTGPPGSPVAFETELCWVLGGEVNSSSVLGNHIASQHVIVMMDHAEPVPEADLNKPESEVYYLLIHVVRKEASSTTRVRAVFDASARSSPWFALNDIFLVGPTIHPSLIDIHLRFRSHRVAHQPLMSQRCIDLLGLSK